MKRYKLTIEYDGTDYAGWQIQPDIETVEGVLEKAFKQILQQEVDIVGQGRTDAGVHALGQTAHIDLPDETDPDKLIFGVNGLAGRKIHIHAIEKKPSEFHARFDADSRAYEYRVLKKPSPLNDNYAWRPGFDPDFTILQGIGKKVRGEYDFNGFSKFNEDNYTTLCTILESEWREEDAYYVYYIRANRFLRNMVRRLVGTMVEVASARMEESEFFKILEKPDAGIKTISAPAKGLRLVEVFY